ncbi:hypothetical protein [Xenorhabdus ehlersii]|uniref:Uncharacterized protein n=1 Tax=Xenorhabdus ehlersii TaxID=290111 RepID=A0A2D0INF6_9GAMM|nr:hypothetical protein [Xenorhabdus ehlersii]PHM23366.1 hypothetical protein Xehl_02897 [Xenorhabdus ehlersii]RKE93370.1 hypothetical protein BDE27_1107 [Xenorhabdus ehlersii]
MSSKKNKIENVWHKNNLPEMEYCDLIRASELLGCKINDLLHFAEEWKIQLCIKLNHYEAALFTPFKYSNIKDWESFCVESYHIFTTRAPETRTGSVSRFIPKFRITTDQNTGEPINESHYEYKEYEELKHPIVYLSGLWVIFGCFSKDIFGELKTKGCVELSALDFFLAEADYECLSDNDDTYTVAPLTSHLYENMGLIEDRVKPIVTLTPVDLYITKTQINRLHESIGGEITRLKAPENEQPQKTDTHHTKIKARENRLKIHKAIIRLFALYPHNQHDENTSYRSTDGRLIVARIAKCLDYHAATLFDDSELPIKDDLTLRTIISDYLKDMGWIEGKIT